MNTRNLLVSALVVGLALPAFAQDGFRVGVQVGSMKTTGPATQFGLTQNPSTSSINTLYIDQPTQTPMALDLAWVRGDDEFSLTYFSTKKKGTTSYMDPASPIIFGGIIFSSSSAGLTASNEYKATLIDATWKRTLIKGDAGSFAFSAGLRYSKVTDELNYQQLDAASNPTGIYSHVKGEGTGFGLVSGLHGKVTFSDRMWLTTGFAAALINNTNKTDDYSIATGGPVTTFMNDDSHQSLLQTDAYLRFNMNFVSNFNGYLGYEVRDFNKDAARVSNVYTGVGLPTTSGFGLSGFTLGLSYTF
ncbi:MAG: hypothetical protein JST24_09995 [Acidobacteria bacterium]|nr:hypothetical protein [Acidobacteriota bacterium]